MIYRVKYQIINKISTNNNNSNKNSNNNMKI